MRDFFRGWKRKLGIVMLLMACDFMGGWMRSNLGVDAFDLFNLHVSSKQGLIEVMPKISRGVALSGRVSIWLRFSVSPW